MLGGWFGRQALKKFLGAIDFTAPGASGQTKNAYKLSLTLVCPQDLISGHLDRFYQGSSQFGRMLWFYLVRPMVGLVGKCDSRSGIMVSDEYIQD
jgi:hypothetical protein